MDIQILLALQNFRSATGGFLNSFFVFITNIAVDYYIILPAFIIFWAVDKKKGLRILTTWGTALYIGPFLKATFCVYRPWVRSADITPVPEAMAGATGYSFPSGHSTSSSGFYSGLYLAFKKYKAICVFAVTMVLLTMFSRIYVGVHTPQDVIIGGLVGVVAALIVSKVILFVEKNPDKDWVVLLISTVLVIALLLYTYFKKYPMDYVDGELLVDPSKMTIDGFKDPGRFFGIVLGWFLERRFVKFDVSGTIYEKVTRCLFGGLLYIFVWTAICDPIGKAIGFGPVHFVLQTGIQVLFMTLYPYLATRKKK